MATAFGDLLHATNNIGGWPPALMATVTWEMLCILSSWTNNLLPIKAAAAIRLKDHQRILLQPERRRY